MNSTALGAENAKKQEIVFINEAHEKLKEVRKKTGLYRMPLKPDKVIEANISIKRRSLS